MHRSYWPVFSVLDALMNEDFIDEVVTGLRDEIGTTAATMQYLLNNMPKPSNAATWHHWHAAVVSLRTTVPFESSL